VRGTWGAAPVAGLEPQPGDLVVERNRLSELSNMTVSSRLPSNIPHTSIRLCA
jgi:hypothetical protein